MTEETAAPVDAPGSLARGAAVITVATAVSRITGFARVMVVAAAVGTTFLANTYQTANTAPNVVFELVAAGVLTSIFVPTFVEYLVKGERQRSWDAANALTSVALVGLIALAILLALGAPWVMRLLTISVRNEAVRSSEIALGSDLLRLFAPQVAFYGVGMIMTSALHAHRRFAMPAIAPIFNNVVVIAVYLTYMAMRGDRPPAIGAVTTAETWVLGAGTTLGVVAMTFCLVPQLVRLGWRFRWRFELSNPAVRKAARVGIWALGYAGGYQAGLIVVLMLANDVRGGVAAYQWAFTFFYVPHALFAAPIFHVLFPAMSEDVAKGQQQEFIGRLRDGLGMLTFILMPVAALMLATADPLTRVTLEWGVMTGRGSDLVARVLAAFAVGLPTYSAFLVFTRAYYSMSDARTPALVNGGAVIASSAAGAALFFTLPREWSVAGLALGHSLGFALGTVVLARLLSRRVSHVRSTALTASIVRSIALTIPAAGVMALLRYVLPEATLLEALLSLIAVALGGALVYGAAMLWARSPEMTRMLHIFERPRRARSLEPVRVLQVLPLSAGGIGKHVAEVVSALDGQHGLVVDVAGPPAMPVTIPKPVQVVDIPDGPVRGHLRAVRRLRDLIDAGGYEVVHAHGLRAGIDAGIAARRRGVPVVLTVHNLIRPEVAGRARAPIYGRAEPLAVRLAALVFGASEQIAEHLRRVAPGAAERIEVLYVSIEPPEVRRGRDEVRRELGLSDRNPLVVTVARLAPQKGLPVMLEAIARLHDDVVLAIVGDGPLEGDLRTLAGKLGIEQRVRFLGFRSDVGDYIAAADVFCLSSVWEAVALAAKEAVLLGTPVVTTDAGGMTELITDRESGRVVARGDASGLARALADVLAHPGEAALYARRARERLESVSSRQVMAERLTAAYMEVASEG